MPKLTDADVIRLRKMSAEGSSRAELAREFGVSVQYVGRILRGEQRAQLVGLSRATLASSSTVDATRGLIEGLTLDARGSVLAQTALALAEKLDSVRAAESAAAANAAPAIARQLVDVLHELQDAGDQPDALDELRRRREARLLTLAAG